LDDLPGRHPVTWTTPVKMRNHWPKPVSDCRA
jgi:hypothetical protein